MQTSVRSQLMAGSAAVLLGAGALAVAPVPVSGGIPALAVPSTAQVALAAFDNPLSELLLTLGAVNNNIFNGADLYGDFEWEPYQGLVPEFIYTALPIISQLGFNGGAYIGGSIDALGTSAYILSQAVWNLPGAVVTAAGQAIGGDIGGAITTLIDATVVPVQAAGSTALGALISVVSGVVTNLVNVAVTVPGIAAGLVNTLIGGVSGIAGAVVNIATQTVGALLSFDVETAWNTVVDGLFGPLGADGTVGSSLPGTLTAVTIGPGLGPLGYPNGYAVPSLRMWGEQSQLQIANALGASYPVSAAAEAPSAASVRSAAAAVAAPDSAPAAAATPDDGDNSSAAAPAEEISTAESRTVTTEAAADTTESAADATAATSAKAGAVRSSGRR